MADFLNEIGHLFLAEKFYKILIKYKYFNISLLHEFYPYHAIPTAAIQHYPMNELVNITSLTVAHHIWQIC